MKSAGHTVASFSCKSVVEALVEALGLLAMIALLAAVTAFMAGFFAVFPLGLIIRVLGPEIGPGWGVVGVGVVISLYLVRDGFLH